MKKEKTGTSPIDAALSFLTGRARTVREVENRLDSLNYGEYEVYAAVERLKELGYLDDERYAEDFIASRLATRPVSRRKLREQLLTHLLPGYIIDVAIAGISDEAELESAVAVAQKYARQFINLDENDRKTRTAGRLFGRGYDYGTVKQAMRIAFGDMGDIENIVTAGSRDGAQTYGDED